MGVRAGLGRMTAISLDSGGTLEMVVSSSTSALPGLPRKGEVVMGAVVGGGMAEARG